MVTITLNNEEAVVAMEVLKTVRRAMNYDNSLDRYIDGGNVVLALDEINYLRLSNTICHFIEALKK